MKENENGCSYKNSVINEISHVVFLLIPDNHDILHIFFHQLKVVSDQGALPQRSFVSNSHCPGANVQVSCF